MSQKKVKNLLQEEQVGASCVGSNGVCLCLCLGEVELRGNTGLNMAVVPAGAPAAVAASSLAAACAAAVVSAAAATDSMSVCYAP